MAIKTVAGLALECREKIKTRKFRQTDRFGKILTLLVFS